MGDNKGFLKKLEEYIFQPVENTYKPTVYDPNTGSYVNRDTTGVAAAISRGVADPSARPNITAAQSGFAKAGATPTVTGAQMQASRVGAAPNAATALQQRINVAPQDQTRQQQQGLVSALQARAAGSAPSAAEISMQRGMADAIAAQRSQVASASGANRALAQRISAGNTATLQQGAISQGAQLRAQEQAAAEGALGQALSGVRGQDIGLAESQAQLAQQTALQNASMAQQARGWQQEAGIESARLAQQAAMQNVSNQQQASMQNASFAQQAGLATQANQQQAMLANASMTQQASLANQELAKYYMSTGMNLDEANRQAQMDLERLKAEQNIGVQQIYGQQAEANAARAADLKSSVISAGGQAAGGLLSKISDRRAKTEIKTADKETDGFMRALQAYAYRYKDEEDGEGQQYGIMAQDIEKTEVGKAIVRQLKDGKKIVDGPNLLHALAATIGRMGRRLEAVEGKAG